MKTSGTVQASKDSRIALPKLSYPTFDLTLPSTKQEIKMRPFLVREEKILLIAQQTEEPREVIGAIRQVINNCVVIHL